jgi:hypothetical protein
MAKGNIAAEALENYKLACDSYEKQLNRRFTKRGETMANLPPLECDLPGYVEPEEEPADCVPMTVGKIIAILSHANPDAVVVYAEWPNEPFETVSITPKKVVFS